MRVSHCSSARTTHNLGMAAGWSALPGAFPIPALGTWLWGQRVWKLPGSLVHSGRGGEYRASVLRASMHMGSQPRPLGLAPASAQSGGRQVPSTRGGEPTMSHPRPAHGLCPVFGKASQNPHCLIIDSPVQPPSKKSSRTPINGSCYTAYLEFPGLGTTHYYTVL